MDYVAWLKTLDEGKLEGVYLCTVAEPYLWDQMKMALKASLDEGLLDFNYDLLPFEEVDAKRLNNALETLPVMAPKRIVIVEEVALARDQLKAFEQPLSVLSEYVDHPNPFSAVFLSFRGQKPFQGKLVKKLKKQAQWVVLDRLDRHRLQRFIEKQFRRAGIRWTNGVLQRVLTESGYLERNSEKTLYDVENEVQKAIGAAVDGTLTEAALDGLLIQSIDDNIFRLMDCLSAREGAKAVRLYQGFRQLEEDPYRIFYMTVRQIRNLLGVKVARQQKLPDSEAQTRMKLSPFEYGKLKQAVTRFSLAELSDLHAALWAIEVRMKTQPTDLPFALEQFFLSCGEGVHSAWNRE